MRASCVRGKRGQYIAAQYIKSEYVSFYYPPDPPSTLNFLDGLSTVSIDWHPRILIAPYHAMLRFAPSRPSAPVACSRASCTSARLHVCTSARLHDSSANP